MRGPKTYAPVAGRTYRITAIYGGHYKINLMEEQTKIYDDKRKAISRAEWLVKCLPYVESASVVRNDYLMVVTYYKGFKNAE